MHHVGSVHLVLFFQLPKLVLSADAQNVSSGKSQLRQVELPLNEHSSSSPLRQMGCGSPCPSSVILTHSRGKTCSGLVTIASNLSPFLQTVLAKHPEK